ncbi:MAG: hypothetical protein N3G79_03840 [Sulfolobales archaeon]|nr:hypothetical protein [Sulfolobales archaeon]
MQYNSSFGAIIGLELISRVDINPNTSIIGALIAIAFSYMPIEIAKRVGDVRRVNLMQTVVSGATFQAGNVLLLTIAVPYLRGLTGGAPFYGVALGVLIGGIIDIILAYWVFDPPFYPAKNPWPPGVATAEAIKAAIGRGKRALLLLYGMVFDGALTYLGYPGDVAGITLITQIVAITAFGVGLVLRAYGPQLFGVDLLKVYAPQDIMVGASIAALIQFTILYYKVRMRSQSSSHTPITTLVGPGEALRKLVVSLALFTAGALLLGLATGLNTLVDLNLFTTWILYTGFRAWFTTLICAIWNVRWVVPGLCYGASITNSRNPTRIPTTCRIYTRCVRSINRTWYG